MSLLSSSMHETCTLSGEGLVSLVGMGTATPSIVTPRSALRNGKGARP